MIAGIIIGKVEPPEVIGYRSLTDQRGPSRTTSTSGGVAVGPPPTSSGIDAPLPSSAASTADTLPRETISARFERVAREVAEKARADIDLESSGAGRGVTDDASSVASSVADLQMQRAVLLNKSDIDDWVKANGVLYDVLSLRTKGVAASLVKKHRPQPRTRGNGYRGLI